jgi:hypothetical protein
MRTVKETATGADHNLSWNCGVEGAAADAEVERLCNRQVKNFLILTLLAIGTPMLLMGDEARRSQGENNNVYCQRRFRRPLSRPTPSSTTRRWVCLTKDGEALLAFYDFPAEHWKHLRTTNPIGSTFATVRHQTVRSKGCLSNRTAIAMVFKLAQAAEKSWRRLDGHSQLPKLITGIKFIDGIEAVSQQPLAA